MTTKTRWTLRSLNPADPANWHGFTFRNVILPGRVDPGRGEGDQIQAAIFGPEPDPDPCIGKVELDSQDFGRLARPLPHRPGNLLFGSFYPFQNFPKYVHATVDWPGFVVITPLAKRMVCRPHS